MLTGLNFVKYINKYLIDYNFFIAFCSVAFLAYFSLLMQYKFPMAIYIFTFCSTLSIYNLFRGYVLFKDFLRDRKNVRFYLILTGFIVSGYCYFILPDEIRIFYLVTGFLTMLYKFNIFGIINLRSVPYLKLPIIAIVWVLTGSIFLLINIHPAMDLKRIAGILSMQFFFIVAISIPFDIFGLIEDEMSTIPNKFGIKKSLWISKILLGLYFLVAILIHIKYQFLYASALICLLTFFAVHFSPKFGKKEFQYYLLDGTIILQTFIFYLFLYR